MKMLKNRSLEISKPTISFKEAILQSNIYEFLNDKKKSTELLSAFNKKKIIHLRLNPNLFKRKKLTLSEIKKLDLTKNIFKVLETNNIKIRSCQYKNYIWILNNPLNKNLQKIYFYIPILLLFLLNIGLTQTKFKTENQALNEKYKFEKTKRYLIKQYEEIKIKKKHTNSNSLSKIDSLLGLPLIFSKIKIYPDTTYFTGYSKKTHLSELELKITALKNTYLVNISKKNTGSYFYLKGTLHDRSI